MRAPSGPRPAPAQPTDALAVPQVIYHPYGGVSNRFDYRTYPAYGGGYGYQAPAPYIKTGLEYTIGDSGYANNYGNSY